LSGKGPPANGEQFERAPEYSGDPEDNGDDGTIQIANVSAPCKGVPPMPKNE